METLTLTELARRVAGRWPVLVTAAAVGLLLATVAHLALPTRWSAVTVVHVEPVDTAPVDMTAEESFATSRRVTTEALDALGETDLPVDDLEHAVHADAVTDSTVLRITGTASSPAAAARRADAVANAYLAARAVDATDRTQRADARLARQARRADPTTRTALTTERVRLSALDATGGEVVDPARVPTSPRGAGLAPTALGGLALGLLVGIPAAAGLSRRPEAPAS